MIFSKFFKAKWQHKDSNVRITTINDDLSPTVADDLNILKQLLNDDNELVRRAALLKINTFEQWLAASSENTNTKVRDYAHQQIVKMLHGQHNIVLTDQQKQIFLTDTKYKALLEPWLQCETDADIVILLIEKINKPHLASTLFHQKQNEKVQQYFIAQTEDVSLLDKFSKKAVNDGISELISIKLAQIKEQKEKPIKLTKKVQLLLAKLLALKELRDYQTYRAKKSVLEQEWQNIQTNFSCFTSEVVDGFMQKQLAISQQLNKVFVVTAEAYQQQIIEQQLTDDKLAAKKDFDQQLVAFSQTLTTSVFENTTLDEDLFTQQLDSLILKVNASVLNKDEQSTYLKSIKQHASRLTQLPDIAKSVTDATGLISKISQLAIPSTLAEYIERQPIFNDWQKSWQVIEKQTNGILPSSIKNAHREIVSAWQKGLKPFAQQQKSLFSQTQKKLSDLKRLLATGKYNASFGLFKGIEKNFVQLSSSQQHRLERDFERVGKQIADLSDLEHYIATPRKQQLLDEINEIVTCPLDNPNEQASKVKQFRQTWNILGHADDDLDKSLNEAFNLACEQAFAPCRLFFSEQEKLREQHLAIRSVLIEQAKVLSSSIDSIEELDFKSLDTQLNKLSQSWSEAGEVDRNKYKHLQQQFTISIQPVKAAISNFHQQNNELKNSLIEKVNTELENEDIYQAIENAKQLQSQWRNIGFAGPRQDNKLWQNFRKANAQLFKKRDLVKADEKEQQSAQKVAFEQQLVSLQTVFIAECDKGQLNIINQQAIDLHQQVISTKPVIKSVAIAIENFMLKINEQLKVIALAQQQQHWTNIFSIIGEVASNKINKESLNTSADYLSLSFTWQKKLVENIFNDNNKASLIDRQLKTLELEILAGIDSPKEYSQQRMAVQVQLMQNKMSSGQDINLEQSFNDWLKQGQLSIDDLPLIARVKTIFCH